MAVVAMETNQGSNLRRRLSEDNTIFTFLHELTETYLNDDKQNKMEKLNYLCFLAIVIQTVLLID